MISYMRFIYQTTSFIIIYDISGDLVSLRALILPLWYKDQNIPRKMSQYNTADALGPCVARPPVSIVLTMSEKRVFVFHEKGLQQYHSNKYMNCANTFVFLPHEIQHTKGPGPRLNIKIVFSGMGFPC